MAPLRVRRTAGVAEVAHAIVGPQAFDRLIGVSLQIGTQHAEDELARTVDLHRVVDADVQACSLELGKVGIDGRDARIASPKRSATRGTLDQAAEQRIAGVQTLCQRSRGWCIADLVMNLETEVVEGHAQVPNGLQNQTDGETVGRLRLQARIAAEQRVVLARRAVDNGAVLSRRDACSLALRQGSRRSICHHRVGRIPCAGIPTEVGQAQRLRREELDDIGRACRLLDAAANLVALGHRPIQTH